MTDSTRAQDGGRDVILTVSGKLGGGRDLIRLDLNHLRSVGTTSYSSTSPWLRERARFTGVLLRDLLHSNNVPRGERIIARAMDNYRTEIPWSDIADYDVMLAFEVNGVPLTSRDKGPLWVVYPLENHPELANVDVNYRWIWQLISLEVR